MKRDQPAPGAPGISPTWCSSSKDLVVTGLGNSRIWATLGYGILNEVYWPSTGRPQIRDLGFIVAKDDQWWELKRLNNYELFTPKPYVLLPTVRHHGDGFSVTLDLVCDDLRDVVLIRYRLEGDNVRLYCLLAPRLGSKGRNNSVYCAEQSFLASGSDEDAHLCLQANHGFSRQSAGFVGNSDGWQDFHEHNGMTWEYSHAEDGNVAAMGELQGDSGVLALSLASTQIGAQTLARSSLADGFDCVYRRVESRWEQWGATWDPPPDLADKYRSQVQHCIAVLKTCEDRLFPGAVVASLSIPWGNAHDDLGGYHLVWARDSVESALAMIAVEQFNEARQLASYLIATQQPDGHWAQNFFPNGHTYFSGVQLDEASFPVLLVAKLSELGQLGNLEDVDTMVCRALGFLLRAGPVTPQDRWEENRGVSVFTIALIIAAAIGGAEFIKDEDERAYLLSYADYLNCRVEDWLYVEGTDLARKYDVEGHYLRMAAPDIFHGQHGDIPIANGGGNLPAESVVALDYLYLSRLGLRSPTHPFLQNTLRVVEGELRVDTPQGPSFYRYTGDGYGEHLDGAPFDGSGKGRLWPLLTGERGHLAVQLRENPNEYLEAMCKMSGPGGLIPEQVWDDAPIPDRHLSPGLPTGSAMPLLWAHAELVKLATAIIYEEPTELLESVRNRYNFQRPEPDTWHWRSSAPFQNLPVGTDLLIEADVPFELHFGFDGWQQISDRPSQPLGFGMHGVRLDASQLDAAGQLDFTLHFQDQQRWEHVDHSIRLAQHAHSSRQPMEV